MTPARFTRPPLAGDDPALRRVISERMNHEGAFHGGLHRGDLVWGVLLDDLQLVNRRREEAAWAGADGESRGLAWLEAHGEAAFARLRTHPVFDPALDLVAADDAGRIGAHATCWWDPIARTGEFDLLEDPEPRLREVGMRLLEEVDR